MSRHSTSVASTMSTTRPLVVPQSCLRAQHSTARRFQCPQSSIKRIARDQRPSTPYRDHVGERCGGDGVHELEASASAALRLADSPIPSSFTSWRSARSRARRGTRSDSDKVARAGRGWVRCSHCQGMRGGGHLLLGARHSLVLLLHLSQQRVQSLVLQRQPLHRLLSRSEALAHGRPLHVGTTPFILKGREASLEIGVQ